MRTLVLLVALLVPGCLFGPDPDAPDYLLVGNDTGLEVSLNVTLVRTDGSIWFSQTFSLWPGQTIRETTPREDLDFTVLARAGEREGRAKLSFGPGPESVEVRVMDETIRIELSHAD